MKFVLIHARYHSADFILIEMLPLLRESAFLFQRRTFEMLSALTVSKPMMGPMSKSCDNLIAFWTRTENIWYVERITASFKRPHISFRNFFFPQNFRNAWSAKKVADNQRRQMHYKITINYSVRIDSVSSILLVALGVLVCVCVYHHHFLYVIRYAMTLIYLSAMSKAMYNRNKVAHLQKWTQLKMKKKNRFSIPLLRFFSVPLTLCLSLSLGHFLRIFALCQRFSVDIPNFDYIYSPIFCCCWFRSLHFKLIAYLLNQTTVRLKSFP